MEDYGGQTAWQEAVSALNHHPDVASLCFNSGAEYCILEGVKSIRLSYLGQPYLITLPEVDFPQEGNKQNVTVRERVLMLHYLLSSTGKKPSGQQISYRELPGGLSYFSVFSQRVINPLIKHFGQEPSRLSEAARLLGGCHSCHGDASVTINAFPRVPLELVCWQGDDEFPPALNILFDQSIKDYLSAEDVSILCESLSHRLRYPEGR